MGKYDEHFAGIEKGDLVCLVGAYTFGQDSVYRGSGQRLVIGHFDARGPEHVNLSDLVSVSVEEIETTQDEQHCDYRGVSFAYSTQPDNPTPNTRLLITGSPNPVMIVNLTNPEYLVLGKVIKGCDEIVQYLRTKVSAFHAKSLENLAQAIEQAESSKE